MLQRCIRMINCRLGVVGFNKIKVHTNSIQLNFSSYDKDLPNPNLPTPVSKIYAHDTDILLEELRKAKTIDRVLELTSMHLDVMNSNHIIASFDNVYNFIKSNDSLKEALLENRTFQDLCAHMMRKIRQLDADEIITVYKTLNMLHVKNNTYVMQSVLKMIGAHLNDMHLGQLTFLHFLLNKQRPNALVDGLKLALPLVLQVQIDQQLNSDNLTEVVNCLQIASRAMLKPATIEKIVSAVLNKCKVLTPGHALTIIYSLLNLQTPVEGYRTLIDASFAIISKNMELISPKQLISVVRLCRSQCFYHSLFLFSASNKIILEKWDLSNTYEIINHFHHMSFCPSNLKDYFVDVICLEGENFKNCKEYSPLSCVEYLSDTGYIPSNIDEAVQVICSSEEKIMRMTEFYPNLLIKFLSCLSMLGHFPEKLLIRVLNEEYLFNALSQSKKQGRVGEFERNVFSLVWSLEIYDLLETYHFPTSLLKRLSQSIFQRHVDIDYPLAKFIENGIGGPQFLQSGVFTHDGHVVDHILAMRSGNYPVSLQVSENYNEGPQNLVFVEDIVLPEDAKIVAVIVAYDEQYCKDPEVLRGWMDVKVRSLAKKKCTPVVIHYTNWKNMPDREKIPYLMQQIKQAVEDHNVVKTYV